MKSLPDIVVIIVAIIIVVWGSLFITVLNQSGQIKKLQAQDNKLAATAKQISTQNENLLQQIKNVIAQDNTLAQQNRDQSFCFVKAFAIYTQTHQPITLSQIQACNIIPSSPAGATGGTKSAIITPTPSPQPATPTPNPSPTGNNSGNNGDNNGNGNGNPPPKPKPGLIKQLLNMLSL